MPEIRLWSTVLLLIVEDMKSAIKVKRLSGEKAREAETSLQSIDSGWADEISLICGMQPISQVEAIKELVQECRVKCQQYRFERRKQLEMLRGKNMDS